MEMKPWGESCYGKLNWNVSERSCTSEIHNIKIRTHVRVFNNLTGF